MDYENHRNHYENQILYNDKNQLVVQTVSVPIVRKNKKRTRIKFFGKFMAVIIGISAFGFSIGAGSTFVKYNFIESTTVNSTTSNQLQPMIQNTGKYYSNTKEVVEDVKDSVVSIVVEYESYRYYSNIPTTTESAGSGIIMKEDEEKIYIATNNHVIQGANKVYISVDDFNKVPATYVGSDASVDLAVISVLKSDINYMGIKYKLATFGSESDIVVGEVAIAMGNALGLGKTATQGIVSAIDKSIEVEGRHLKVIQTDAAINPGNSGGALVNSKGLVIGINTAKLSSSSAEGIGYSIPITVAQPILEELILNGNVSKPYIGIEGLTITEDILIRYSLPSYGIYISGVVNNSGASEAGLMLGDIITEYNVVKIQSMEDLGKMIDNSNVGDKVTLKIVRGTRVGEIVVTLKNLSQESF